jgi:hypothetical protein
MEDAVIACSVTTLLLTLACVALHEASLDDSLPPRSRLVGLKTRATLRSDEAWAAGHAAARPVLRVGAVVGATSVVVALVTALATVFVAAVVAVTGLVTVLGLLVLATLTATRAAKRA